MDSQTVKRLIGEEKVVPILRTDSADELVGVAQAVTNAGMRILELTMTIPGAAEKIPELKAAFPNLVIGMGTVMTSEEAKRVIENGADFVVSPILNYDIVDATKGKDILLMLAAFTPTEIYNAVKAGSDIVKIFPANVISPRFIQSIRGPMPNVDLLPTGGLNLISAIQFLQAGSFAVGMGGDIFKKEWIKKGNFEAITRALKNVMYRVKGMEV